ncbi:MAG: hypothetical protein IIB00_09600 [candidate division Zixibacteria bacterium]|nr:hypothetical protein [candidate division Zixibacteria bacterium]
MIFNDRILSAVSFFIALLISPATVIGQNVGEEDGGEAQTAEQETNENTGRHTFWQVDLGMSIPSGSSDIFNGPTEVVFFEAPRPYKDHYRSGFTANFAGGYMTDDGYDASISFRITKVNYNNLGTSLILLATQEEFSSYLLETQFYLGRRIHSVRRKSASPYFGVAGSFGSLEHYSARLSVPDEATFTLSGIAGYEVPLQIDPVTSQMITIRLQAELVALASGERPRYVNLTFGIRGYLD